jgi:tripartite-type tricarboxylate transporter receptor subunit TctC
VLAGEVQVLLTNMASVLPYIAAGKLKEIGISSLKRSSLAPQVPTLHESGLSGFEYATWYGMLVPAGTQQPIVDYLYASTAQVLKTPAVAERFTGQGLQTYASAPSDFDRYLKAEVEKWAKVIKAANIHVD